MREGGGGEEKGFSPSALSLLRFHLSSFPPKRLILRLPSELLTVFSLVYPEEGSIAETSVKILIITASVLQFLNLH